MASNNPVANLASMSMRQLRELARSLGISRYSAQNREGLAEAIADKASLNPQAEAAAAPMGMAAVELAPEAPVVPDLRAIEQDMAPAPRPQAETRVVFLPRDPQWAYAFWEISESDREAALAAGATQLCLRVADVTGLPGGSSHPHTLQEVVVDSHATEWYLPVPLSDRDYRVELGFRSAGGWVSLAFSSVARVPALHPSEQILDQFIPFSLDALPRAEPPSPSPNSRAACMSACIRRPPPVGVVWGAAQKPSMNSAKEATRPPGCTSPAWASGPAVSPNPVPVPCPPASGPSGLWPTLS